MPCGKELNRLTIAMPKTETATPADGPTLQHGFRKKNHGIQATTSMQKRPGGSQPKILANPRSVKCLRNAMAVFPFLPRRFSQLHACLWPGSPCEHRPGTRSKSQSPIASNTAICWAPNTTESRSPRQDKFNVAANRVNLTISI